MDVEHSGIDFIVGRSPWAEQIRIDILRIANTCSSVLILGPTGTGKELIARAIHVHSNRVDSPFVAVDCAGVTDSLFASHLFGHTKGAFTGATHESAGYFRAARGGTIFLDEIGELELDLQAKLLRVLQQRTVTPVGSHEEVPVDVRVLAATNQELEQLVAAGRFREDLYYRLNVISLRTIPLRDRPDDIPGLARHFLAQLAARDGGPEKQLSPRCLACLSQCAWPGNVRELENLLERASLLATGTVLEPDDLRQLPGSPCAAPSSLGAIHCTANNFASGAGRNGRGPADRDARQWPTLDEVERDHIRWTLEHTGYNQTVAAGLLHVDRHQLARKIKKYGLDAHLRGRGRPRKARE